MGEVVVRGESLAPLSVFAMVRRRRPGVAASGGVKSARSYLDFTIDGISLMEVLGGVHDLIGVLGWMSPEADERNVEALLGVRSILETGRAQLYVCPECGDIGCGAVTAIIEVRGDRVTWRDFGLERDWEEPHDGRLNLDRYRKAGPFWFAWAQYREAIAGRSLLADAEAGEDRVQ